MAYEVLARKWRPRQFDDVVGQDHVTRTLKNAIQADRIAHAYLFVGPRGIGKTSVARIFAKALNCEKGPTATPCDTCDACHSIARGADLDVMEIDGASNNGVDQVRELRETVKYAPARSTYKIYIIDEVHMLSVAAFNALLKTLEEPPAHVKFIFATTEPEKLLPTIISRCQRFDLRRIPVPLITERLSKIAEAEKVEIDDDALLAIARGSEGGLRDAESAFDQLISFRGTHITEEDVLSVFGLVSRQTLECLATDMLNGNIRAVVGTIHDLDEAGKDLQRLVVELIGHFRNLLVFIHVKGDATCLDVTPAQVDVLKDQAQLSDGERVMRIVDVLTDTDQRMRYALSRRTLLETGLIRCARAAVAVSLEDILRRIQLLREGGLGDNRGVPAGGANPAYEQVAVEPATVREPGDELAELGNRWSEIVEQVGRVAVLARKSLVDARPESVEGNSIVIGFDPEFAQEIEAFQISRNRKAVERALGRILGRDVAVEFRVSGVSAPAAADTTAARGTREPAPEAPTEKAAERKPAEPKAGSKQWIEDPAVRKTLDVFNGKILDVRE